MLPGLWSFLIVLTGNSNTWYERLQEMILYLRIEESSGVFCMLRILKVGLGLSVSDTGPLICLGWLVSQMEDMQGRVYLETF